MSAARASSDYSIDDSNEGLKTDFEAEFVASDGTHRSYPQTWFCSYQCVSAKFWCA